MEFFGREKELEELNNLWGNRFVPCWFTTATYPRALRPKGILTSFCHFPN